MTMELTDGRNLRQITTSDGTTEFKYNSEGLRTYKSNSDYTTYYYYDSNNNMIALRKAGTVMYFYYDSQGNATSFSFEGMKYFYIKNQQGDVEKIVNKNGNVVVKYYYDDWGNLISMTDTTSSGYGIGSFNPYRYRGYIYDDETGLYYLRSRYYDPVIGRFINADDTAYIGITGTALSANLFSYCENNPINHTDYLGKWIDGNAFIRGSFTVSILSTLLLGNTQLALLTMASSTAIYCALPTRFYFLSLFNKVRNEKYDFSSDKYIGPQIIESIGFRVFLRKIFNIEKNDNSDSISLLRRQIKKLIKMGIKNIRYPQKGSKSVSFYKDNHNLHLSIGDCKGAIRLKFIQNLKDNYQLWKVKIRLSDKYDYDNWDTTKRSDFTMFMNNIVLGWPMSAGILKPYKWKYTYSYTVKVKK